MSDDIRITGPHRVYTDEQVARRLAGTLPDGEVARGPFRYFAHGTVTSVGWTCVFLAPGTTRANAKRALLREIANWEASRRRAGDAA